MTNWDERYRRGEHLNDAPLPLVINAALQCQPGRALDLACGVGRHARWLAEHGWQVTAVDASVVAIEILRQCAGERGVDIDARVADLERGEFVIEPGAYDLIVVTCYLQRDLLPAIRIGVRVGGLVVAKIALVDDDPNVQPMNPAFLLELGELRAAVVGWKLLHDFEGKLSGQEHKRAMAEVIARRLV